MTSFQEIDIMVFNCSGSCCQFVRSLHKIVDRMHFKSPVYLITSLVWGTLHKTSSLSINQGHKAETALLISHCPGEYKWQQKPGSKWNLGWAIRTWWPGFCHSCRPPSAGWWWPRRRCAPRRCRAPLCTGLQPILRRIQESQKSNKDLIWEIFRSFHRL